MVDARDARIGRLAVTLRGVSLDIVLPAEDQCVAVVGQPGMLRPDLAPGAACPREYGLPFSAWPKSTARVAVRAYRSAQASIAVAASTTEVEEAIRGFVRAVNALPGTETTEREDAAEAVARLAVGAPVPVATDLAQSWVDAEREF